MVQSTLVMALLGGSAYGAVAIGRGAIEEAQRVACATDERVVQTAVQSYLVLVDDPIVPTGSGPDRYESTLVAHGFLVEASRFHDVTATGDVVPADLRC